MDRTARNLLIPIVLGGVQAILTLNLETLSVICGNPVVGAFRVALFRFSFPECLGRWRSEETSLCGISG